jgi:hypothetical protein
VIAEVMRAYKASEARREVQGEKVKEYFMRKAKDVERDMERQRN